MLAIAFKEWAVVCAALADGTQTIIVRKGGIHEGREGFRVEHERFWLYPTGFHQTAEQLKPGCAALLQAAEAWRPRDGKIPLDLIAQVTAVRELRGEADLAALEPRVIYAPDVLRQRFHYRAPGLYVLDVSITRRATPHWVVETSAYAGCKSWVELAQPLPM
ncbi:MAG: DUF1802 family protein [Pirellulales bacterium]